MQISALHLDAPTQNPYAVLDTCSDCQGVHGERWRQEATAFNYSHLSSPAPRELQSSENRLRLLQVSDEAALSDTRRAMLQRIGFSVEVTSSAEADVNRFPEGFAVLLLCQSLTVEQAFHVADRFAIADVPPTTVRVTRDPGFCTSRFDVVLQSPVMPRLFVDELTKLFALAQMKRGIAYH